MLTLVADVRFLPNPYWDEQLRPLTGQDAAVSDSVLERPGAREFLSSFSGVVNNFRERATSEKVSDWSLWL